MVETKMVSNDRLGSWSASGNFITDGKDPFENTTGVAAIPVIIVGKREVHYDDWGITPGLGFKPMW